MVHIPKMIKSPPITIPMIPGTGYCLAKDSEPRSIKPSKVSQRPIKMHIVPNIKEVTIPPTFHLVLNVIVDATKIIAKNIIKRKKNNSIPIFFILSLNISVGT